MAEAGVEVRVGGVWVRMTGRSARYGQPRAEALSIMLVAPSGAPLEGRTPRGVSLERADLGRNGVAGDAVGS